MNAKIRGYIYSISAGVAATGFVLGVVNGDITVAGAKDWISLIVQLVPVISVLPSIPALVLAMRHLTPDPVPPTQNVTPTNQPKVS